MRDIARARIGPGATTAWRWTALAGIGVIIVMYGFGTIAGMRACGGGDPIFAFEMVRSPAEVAALFPASCRAAHIAAQRTGLWIDSGLFIWVYSAFLIGGLLALRAEGGASARRLAVAGMVTVGIAAAADQFENVMLLRLLTAWPGDQPTVDLLYLAPRIKFALLGVATTIAGILHLRRPGWRRLAGVVASLGGLVATLGVFVDHHWVLKGNAIGWSALLVVALAGAIAPARQTG